MRVAARIGLTVGLLVGTAGFAVAVRHDPAQRSVTAVPRPAVLAATPFVGPECKEIQGEELAANDRWRVVRTGDGGEFGDDYSPTPVVACDLRAPGAARVRVLGMAKLTGGGEDYVTDGGPYVEHGRIGGDLVLIDSRFYAQLGNQGPDRETGFTTLYDLRRGASMRLPGTELQLTQYRSRLVRLDTLKDHTLHAVLTPRGALATVFTTKDGVRAPVHFGPIRLWDGAGVRTLATPLRAIADTDGRTGNQSGLYYRTRGGEVGRTVLHAAAATDGLAPDPTLAWQQLALATEQPEPPDPPESEQLGSTFQFLPAASAGPGPSDPFGTSLWLHYRPSDRARNRTVTITTEAGTGTKLVRLARNGDRGLRTLTSDGSAALLIGRFAEHPTQSRVRLVGQGVSKRAQAFFDRPATRGFRHHAHALLGQNLLLPGRYALTDGTTPLALGTIRWSPLPCDRSPRPRVCHRRRTVRH